MLYISIYLKLQKPTNILFISLKIFKLLTETYRQKCLDETESKREKVYENPHFTTITIPIGDLVCRFSVALDANFFCIHFIQKHQPLPRAMMR